MAERIFVKPAADVKVRLSDSKKHVPDAGAWVEKTSYIIRRINEGSLVEVQQTAPVAAKKAPAVKKTTEVPSEGDQQ